MLLARAFSDSGGRIEEDLLTKLTHLAKNFFEPTVVGNGLLIELCLLFGQSHRDRPGFDLSMNIDAAWKDIQDWNQRVESQARFRSEEGQSNCDDVDKRCHQRPVHRGAHQAGMNLRIDVAVFGGGIPPMQRQRQADCDLVGSIDCDRKPCFRVFTS